jgi:AhpD family alkylhydroperoxidase
MFFLSMPRTAATASWTACGFCVGVHTVALFPCTSATAAGGSIEACAAIGV